MRSTLLPISLMFRYIYILMSVFACLMWSPTGKTVQSSDEGNSAQSHNCGTGPAVGCCPHTAGHVHLAALDPAPRTSLRHLSCHRSTAAVLEPEQPAGRDPLCVDTNQRRSLTDGCGYRHFRVHHESDQFPGHSTQIVPSIGCDSTRYKAAVCTGRRV